MADIVTLGDINVDIIAHHPEYPIKGGDALSESTETRLGGSAANTAVALARMGIDAAFVGCVGADALAQMLVDSLAEAGVDQSGLQQHPETATGLMYVVVTPDGERTMFGCRGANIQTDPAQIPRDLVAAARLFHLSGYALLAEPQRRAALQSVRQSVREGVKIVLDPGMSLSGGALRDVLALLPDVDILLPNLAEAQRLAGDTTPRDCARALLGAGVGVVLIKLGADGCLLGENGLYTRIPGFAMEPLDSTGAGDSFAAGVVAGCLAGLDWESSALLANAMGALTAGRVDGGIGPRLPAQVLSILKSGLCEPRFSALAGPLTQAASFVESIITEKRG